MHKLPPGFLLINKPNGPTSHDMIDRLRRELGVKKIGHAGTLDPLASGLLIVAVGREATKQISQFVKLDKEYVAEIFFGAVSDTYDAEGKITITAGVAPVSEIDLRQALQKFIGEQDQLPPIYSAKKIGGKKLYEIARAGQTVEIKPSRITIFELELMNYAWPLASVRVACSSGTYIRSLAHDLGQALGCGAYLNNLIRTRIGEWGLAQIKN